MSLKPGATFGQYEILGPLGAGGMGEVYRARDTKLGRDVALKALPARFTADEEWRARFEREARLLAALNHPHIGAIYGVEEAHGVPALVLELVEGPTLADRMASGPIRVSEMLELGSQIADALEAAHEKGVIHRDVKPTNIKITSEGVVKVLDFGIAKAFAAHASDQDLAAPTATHAGTREGSILGTAAYMSPEQARGKPVDKRTDIWAFGCVLYEALTGRPAFAGATIPDTIAAILEREPMWSALPDKTPTSVRRLLKKCLEKDLRRRLRDIGDARIELDDALALPKTEVAAGAGIRKRGLRSDAVAAVLALVASIAMVGWWRATRPVPGRPCDWEWIWGRRLPIPRVAPVPFCRPMGPGLSTGPAARAATSSCSPERSTRRRLCPFRGQSAPRAHSSLPTGSRSRSSLTAS